MTAVAVYAEPLTLEVYGVPVPKGSMSAVRRGNKTIMLEGKGNAAREASTSWRQAVETAARDWLAANGAPPPIDEPVAVTMTFRLPRPPSIPKKRVLPDRKPDLDKTVRHALDSLTGLLFTDDARVCELVARKRYAIDAPPGCTITIEVLG